MTAVQRLEAEAANDAAVDPGDWTATHAPHGTTTEHGPLDYNGERFTIRVCACLATYTVDRLADRVRRRREGRR